MKKLILILLFLGCEGQSQNRIPSELPSLIVHETIDEEMSQEIYERMLTDSTFFYLTDEMEMSTTITNIELWYSDDSINIELLYSNELWYTVSDTTSIFWPDLKE